MMMIISYLDGAILEYHILGMFLSQATSNGAADKTELRVGTGSSSSPERMVTNEREDAMVSAGQFGNRLGK